MVMKIKYGENEVVIAGINPTQERLEITVSADNVTFDTLKELKGYQGAIQYYEDNTLMIEYSGYNADFNCIYIGNDFTVTLQRVGAVEQAVEQANTEITMLLDTITVILTEIVPSIMGMY